ncbi:hypothetical protein ACFPRL_16030 [Pseudoclavibacter helvolus]
MISARDQCSRIRSESEVSQKQIRRSSSEPRCRLPDSPETNGDVVLRRDECIHPRKRVEDEAVERGRDHDERDEELHGPGPGENSPEGAVHQRPPWLATDAAMDSGGPSARGVKLSKTA